MPTDNGEPFYPKMAQQTDAAYKDWIKAHKLRESDDYDLYAAYRAGLQPDERGHLDDTFKKPNHITFSTDSNFSTPERQGGTWEKGMRGEWVFKASSFNLSQHSAKELEDYFRRNEPDSVLVLPDGTVVEPRRK